MTCLTTLHKVFLSGFSKHSPRVFAFIFTHTMFTNNVIFCLVTMETRYDFLKLNYTHEGMVRMLLVSIVKMNEHPEVLGCKRTACTFTCKISYLK